MSARLHFVVEGQTEETFINRTIIPHLASLSVWGDVRCVMTRKHRRYIYRGGLSSYIRVKNDLTTWMKEDNNPDSFFTTMFDLYALPGDFPEFDAIRKISGHDIRVMALENSFGLDIKHPRFIPHIQLHEFETLILVDPQQLISVFVNHQPLIDNLVKMVQEFKSPEQINDGEETAPSKRIIKEIPEYEGMKTSAGPLVTEKIGLANIRHKCNHFNQWLEKLEKLGQQ
jgi:hypothetical protein